MNELSVAETAARLRAAEDILLLCHKNPDGDTLGSAFGLCYALQAVGKRVQVKCSDPVPKMYSYMTDAYFAAEKEFAPRFVAALDAADDGRLGTFSGTPVDVCIDHHGTNSGYAAATLLRADYASTAEIVSEVIAALGVDVSPLIADCLYTGLSTDTGCFRFQNTTPNTLRLAATLAERGADMHVLNVLLFDTKSRARIALEQLAMAGLEYYCDGQVAIMTLTLDMFAKSGATVDDTEGLTALPRAIEGVEAGATIRECEGFYKVSLRTKKTDSARICAAFGGGGHPRAAGFEWQGKLSELKKALLEKIGEQL